MVVFDFYKLQTVKFEPLRLLKDAVGVRANGSHTRLPPLQINGVLPVLVSAVQCLDSFCLLEDSEQLLRLSPGTLSHQRLQQLLLVSLLCLQAGTASAHQSRGL